MGICIALAALSWLVFGQTLWHDFVNYDDPRYVYENTNITEGLSISGIVWAFTHIHSMNWHPLTTISHMLDCQLYGLKAGWHHCTNVLLHSIAVMLLFVGLLQMTGAFWRSAFVAAVFAIHPLRVESVAWIAERKDVLSGVFFMLTLLAYLYYVRLPRTGRYLVVAFVFACGLMSKPMLVTLPFVLLLLDFWPLGRGVRIKEKSPLLALTIFGAIMAIVGQRNLSALQSVEAVPLATRLSNAAVAYIRYIGKFFAPMNLAVVYPMQPIAAGVAAAAALLLVVISIAAFRYRAKAPYFFTGWFWFLGTLVPVIGIVQIGTQAIADRYTYFSFIGLSIAVVWSIPRRVLAPVAAVVVIAFAAIAYRQVGYWRDSETLFEHTIAVTPPNPMAEYSIGQTFELTKPDRAIEHLQRAIRLSGHASEWTAQAHVGLGTALMMKARPLPPAERTPLINEAIAEFQRALSIDPSAAHARNNIALAHQWLSASAPLFR